ncbi:MAG: type II secretion system F family protein [Blastococcus sp.]
MAVALAAWPGAGGLAAHRLAAVGSMRGLLPRGHLWRRLSPAGEPARRWLLSVAGGLAVTAVLGGGPLGVGAAVAAAVALGQLLRRDTGDRRVALATGHAVERDLPGACDLLAVCLTAGLPVGAALAGVGAAVGGPVGAQLRSVADLLRLGAEPRQAWAATPPELAPLGRVLVRAGESGATVTAALRAQAAEFRAGSRARTEVAVRRAGVWVLAPLGLCFLPAFVCLGVVPLVLGLAGSVFR